MNVLRRLRWTLAGSLAVCLVAAVLVITTGRGAGGKTHLTAYFDNSNGIYVGDDVRIMGVTVGKIDRIEPQLDRAQISFWIDNKYSVPASAHAVILSPSLVTARAIQLTPAYTSGPTLNNNGVIPEQRTAVPIEWDDFRDQLEKLTETLQPTHEGGVSTLGGFITTTADNLRGQGSNIRDTVLKLSTAFSTLGDHSGDIFSTVRHLAALVSALQSSTDLMRQLNANLAAVTGLLTNQPREIATAATDLNAAIADVNTFLTDHHDTIGTTGDQLAALTTTITERLDDVKQALHVTPNTLANFNNIYSPSTGSPTAILALNNFANPIQFICGAIQAASRLGAEQSAKLCVQYLAPIVKNRQYNFPPIGTTAVPIPIPLPLPMPPFIAAVPIPIPVTAATARPNEITFSEDRLRPDYRPTPPAPHNDPATQPPGAPLAADAPIATDPNAGLPGLMIPPRAGS